VKHQKQPRLEAGKFVQSDAKFVPSQEVPFSTQPAGQKSQLPQQPPPPPADMAAKVKYESIVLSEEPPTSSKDESSRTRGDDSSVNYGYHPIIDFFQKYRFSSDA